MFDNLIYSLNSTVPVFLCMVLGYILYRVKMLNDNFVSVANKLVFRVTLPVMLFSDMASIDLKNDFDLKYVLYCAIVTTVAFFGIWGFSKLFVKDKRIRGEFVQSSYRSSAAILGAAFISNIYGSSGMAPLMMIGSVPLFNIYAVLVLSLEGDADAAATKQRIKTALLEIVKNPIIDSILLGLIVAAIKIALPQLACPTMIDKTLSSVASLTSPLALLAIGAGFKGQKTIQMAKEVITAALFKTVILAAVFLPIAIALGFTDQKLIALVVMLGSPATPTCYVMAKNMGHEGVLSSGVIVLTTLLSALTLTAWIYLMRVLGVVA